MLNKFITMISYIFVLLMASITLFPFIYTMLVSLSTHENILAHPLNFFNHKFNISNYTLILADEKFRIYLINTLITATISTLSMLLTTIMSMLALIKLNFQYKNLVLSIIIILAMVPQELLVFNNYITVADIGLMNTYRGLILPYTTNIFYILYLNGYISSMPLIYYNTARAAGISDWNFILKVLIPLAKPGIVVMGLLNFIENWHSFIWPILITNDRKMRLISEGLIYFTSEHYGNISVQMAAIMISILPIIIIYLIFRKEIIKEIVNINVK
ncbi:MAG: hypothetical protein ATN31_09420 [Candidatus Epulonipiscioides saccharophilum]|nr:MAG: hypothetical protein ATN31_09420 [Epulopiscium sp. AS2M-Bin001]